MIESLHTPRGLNVRVAETRDEDQSTSFDAREHESIRSYYEREGYVVVRNVFDGKTCDLTRTLWESEVKPSKAFLYRQATAKSERHQLNANGWVMNPILNLQSLDPKRFPRFRRWSRENVLTAAPLVAALENLLSEPPKIVQSMYFEGNSATWEHQDSYYLDSENLGSMVGSWIALEDIAARAGRFFVVPRSHLIRMPLQSSETNVATNHEKYIQSVVEEVKQRGLEVRAPALGKGDVLFWNSYTVHGSLDTQHETRSRSSITCHAIPESHNFVQLQSRRISLSETRINDVVVHCPKDLANVSSRVVHFVESYFPRSFYAVKRNAVRLMVARASSKRQSSPRT